MVVINKIDKPTARSQEVIDMLFDLFISLGATDEQCDFPIIYASAKA
jgi:GTP-binding protein